MNQPRRRRRENPGTEFLKAHGLKWDGQPDTHNLNDILLAAVPGQPPLTMIAAPPPPSKVQTYR